MRDAAAALERVVGTPPEIDADQRALSVVATAPQLPVVIRELDAAGIRLDDVALRRPTLDEVFLSITGTETR